MNPKLKPTVVIAIIRATVETSPDWRRMLLHPAKAVAAAEKRKA